MKLPEPGEIEKETDSYVRYWEESRYPDAPLHLRRENKYPCVGGPFARVRKCATQVEGKDYIGFNKADYARRGGWVPKKVWVHKSLIL